MGRKLALYAAGLIGLYLVVKNYTGFAKDESSASTGASGLVEAFQGR